MNCSLCSGNKLRLKKSSQTWRLHLQERMCSLNCWKSPATLSTFPSSRDSKGKGRHQPSELDAVRKAVSQESRFLFSSSWWLSAEWNFLEQMLSFHCLAHRSIQQRSLRLVRVQGRGANRWDWEGTGWGVERQSDTGRSHKDEKRGFLKKWEVLPCVVRQEVEKGQKRECWLSLRQRDSSI